jgi:raffinose/stachyose/melibiose transport system permease protein
MRYSLLCFYSIISLYPIIFLGFTSLKTNKEIWVTNPFLWPRNWEWINYKEAVDLFPFFRFGLNSVIISTLVIVVTIVLTVMLAYALSHSESKLAHFIRFYVISGVFVTASMIIIPLAVVINKNLHLANTYYSVSLALIALNIPFSTMLLYGFFRSLPVEIEEAAFIDGAGQFRTLLSIMVPMITPAIATLTIILFMSSWNEFFLPLILISKRTMQTLPLGLLTFQGNTSTHWGAIAAALLLSSIPVIVMYLLFSDKVEKAMGFGAGLK